MKKYPDDYSHEEIKHLAEIGLKADMDRCARRFFKELGLDETTPYSPELARKLERYLKLNPGGIASPNVVKVYRHKE